MDNIKLEQKKVLEYLSDALNDIKIKSSKVVSDKFHHNSSYNNASLIIEHGILSLKEQNKIEIRNDSVEYLNLMNDTNSHINGIDAISLSVVGLTDLYPDEYEYDPLSEKIVDFIVSSKVKVHRSTLNYGNEYLCYDNITSDKLRSIDIRLIKFIELLKNKNKFHPDESIVVLIEKYNCLIEMGISLKKMKLDIPIREMSGDSIMEMDIDKLSKAPRLALKK